MAPLGCFPEKGRLMRKLGQTGVKNTHFCVDGWMACCFTSFQQYFSYIGTMGG